MINTMNVKKMLLPLVACLAFAFNGCTREPAALIETYYVTVDPGAWSRNADMGYLFYECSLPAITQNVIQNGATFAYYIDDYGYDNLLPFLMPYYETDADGNEGLYWENLRYDLAPGKITFIIQESDRYVDIQVASTKKYKVSIMSNR